MVLYKSNPKNIKQYLAKTKETGPVQTHFHSQMGWGGNQDKDGQQCLSLGHANLI